MNRKLMKNKMGILAVFLAVFFGCSSLEGEENFKQLQKIEKGMALNKVRSIMSNDPIILEKAYWSDTLFVESYESPFGTSDTYKIIYSQKDSLVVGIKLGD